MKTTHDLFLKDSKDMNEIESESVDLIITSPPYPMIEMWDDLFTSQNKEIGKYLKEGRGNLAFERMHDELNKVWKESLRVLKEGGILCIDIGDATRKIGKTFQLFPNHVKVVAFFQNNGCIVLPSILWRKPTNSPTKFMGSGMIPPNAYVSLEHEYILIFRKGKKRRKFKPKSERRYNSAFFWEERNKWFSDVWMDMKGISQELESENMDLRKRSAAFPLELPYRLINMFSLYGDTVLDPFFGTGTTSIAAMMLARNSIGYEIETDFSDIFDEKVKMIESLANQINQKRIKQHKIFTSRFSNRKEIKYKSINYDFPVVTKQERVILFYSIKDSTKNENKYTIEHKKFKPNGLEGFEK